MNIIKSLNVWMEHFEHPIGNLLENDKREVIFIYDEAYLASPFFMPLSQMLPKMGGVFSDYITRTYFDNLLQENNQLDFVREREGIDRSDLIGLLYFLGNDLMGSVSCLPMDQERVKIPGDLNTDYDELSDSEIYKIVKALSESKTLPNEFRDPSPIAGVQRKVAITVLGDNKFAFPKEGLRVPTTHILKVPKRQLSIEAYEEQASAKLAHQCGLNVVVPEVVDFNGITGLLIKRFDRDFDEHGNVRRIHQEDFAQALGLPPSMKYERYGTSPRIFNVDNIVNLLMQTVVPINSIRTYILATFFNLAIGNTDNHAKNYALLYNQGAIPTLAPLYDMLPIRLNSGVSHQLSYHIGNAAEFDDIDRFDYTVFFRKFNFKSKAMERFLNKEIFQLLSNVEKYSLGLEKPKLKSFHDLIGRELERINDVLQLGLELSDRDYFEPDARG